MDWNIILQGLLGGLIPAGIALLVAWWKLRSTKEKISAETESIIGDSWSDLVTPMREELSAIRARVREMEGKIQDRDVQREQDRQRITELEDEVTILKQQIIELGHKPRTRRKSVG